MRKMNKITIGNSPITKTIFAGHLNKNGTMWTDKQDCTIDALLAVVEHCIKYGNQEIKNTDTGETEFEITVTDLRKKQ